MVILMPSNDELVEELDRLLSEVRKQLVINRNLLQEQKSQKGSPDEKSGFHGGTEAP